MKRPYTIMKHPFTEEEHEEQINASGMVRGVVEIDMEDIFTDVGLIEMGTDDDEVNGFHEVLKEKLVGDATDWQDMELEYKIVGFAKDTVIHIEVTGRVCDDK